MNKLYWAKVKPDAKVPQKRYEDAEIGRAHV